MQIVIPMSGFGERFRKAGYAVPKPLIEVDGKPIIGHVIDLFPGETDFLFICNQEHLDNPLYQMQMILESLCPTGRVVGIAPHKLGPIHAVQQVENLLDKDRPVIVNYCDFTCYWNWDNFKRFVSEAGCAGAIPAYKGFHPHTLGTTNYAYMLEKDGWVQDIQEKQPYTDNRMEEYASSGTYYFSSAQLMSEAFAATVRDNLSINGEFYVSLAYKYLFKNNMPVAVYPLQHFMQWGTPADLKEYEMWSGIFKTHADSKESESSLALSEAKGSVIIPMAGLGQRFANEGYVLTKPLIPVSGKSMVVQAVSDLPLAQQYVFVLRADMPGYEKVVSELKGLYPGCLIKVLDRVTEGQANTALLGLDYAGQLGNLAEPMTIGACDNGALYDPRVFDRLINDPQIDVIVWGVRGYPNAARHPQMFGWIEELDGKIQSISVKKPLNDPDQDPIVLGTFTFKHAADFRRCVERLIARDGRINGEFYIDACINDAIALGLQCHLFEVDAYLCWGTPNDLRTFEYWQSCFQKWDGHPYRLKHDSRIPSDQIASIARKYVATNPVLPALT
ncbi:NTP transferase domain-containing protein [Polynucleobacter asymbioticus]|uniref:NTP transferase domain-containing protein n=1 Tax=Polynucleobacter asymbioticus TaxID=576611 RepID=UPI0008F8ACD0|nr:sugar phosphate nucleotidyltransferase [Polynucleobacter asymbioticus]